MAIHQIFEIPGMEQLEGSEDYGYTEEYVGKLCKFQDKYILFKEKSFEEFPCALIDIVLKAANENSITEEQLDAKLDEMHSIVSDSKSTLESIVNSSSQDSHIKTKALEKKVDEFSSKITNLQSPEAVRAIVSKELTTVYENYEKVMKKLIHDKATELSKEIKEAANKLQPMDIMMYKKLGMDLPEIIQLAKAGLI